LRRQTISCQVVTAAQRAGPANQRS